MRSSADLPLLGLLVEWAKKARLVRVVKGRLCAVAKARPVLADPLQLWLRAFVACFELRQVLIGARSGWHVESMLFDAYEDVLEDVLNTLYSVPYPMPWPRLRDSVHLAYRARFQLDGASDIQHRMWFEHADRDLRTVLDTLVDLGAIERERGMADPVFLEVDLSAEPELPEGMPPELAELLGAAGVAPDPAAQERDRRLCEELSAGPVELIRLTSWVPGRYGSGCWRSAGTHRWSASWPRRRRSACWVCSPTTTTRMPQAWSWPAGPRPAASGMPRCGNSSKRYGPCPSGCVRRRCSPYC